MNKTKRGRKVGGIKEEDTKGYQFERLFLEVLIDLAEEIGEDNFTRIAGAAFPYLEDPGRSFRRIRNAQKKGKPQSVRLRDAYNLAAAVGKDFPTMCYLSHQKMKELDSKNSAKKRIGKKRTIDSNS